MSRRLTIFSRQRTAGLLLVVLSLWPAAAVRAQESDPFFDGRLFAAWVEAERFAADRQLGPAMEAWNQYVGLINEYREDERKYAEIHDLRRFDVSLRKANLLREMTDTIVPPGVTDDELHQKLAHLRQVAGHLNGYLGQFGNRAAVPEQVTERDRLGAVYMLGENLWRQGLTQARLGQIRAARDNFEAAKRLLRSAIEEILGGPFRKPGSSPRRAGGLVTSMTALYLRQVAQTDDPRTYVDDAKAAAAWLTGDDPAVIEEVGRQAAAWHEEGVNKVAAAELCELVRTAGAVHFMEQGAEPAFRVWVHLVEIQLAFELDQFDKGMELIDALFNIEWIVESSLEQAESMRRLHAFDDPDRSVMPPTQRPARSARDRSSAGGHHDGAAPRRSRSAPAADLIAALPTAEPRAEARATAVATILILFAALLVLAFLRRRGVA